MTATPSPRPPRLSPDEYRTRVVRPVVPKPRPGETP